MGEPTAKMDIRAFGAAIKRPAPSAIFKTGLSKRRSTVRPSPRSFLQTSSAYTLLSVRAIWLRRDRVAAFKGFALSQGCPSDPRQLVGQCDHHRIAVDAALDHCLQPAPQRCVALRQRRQSRSRAMYEQGAQIGVAALRDAEQPWFAASGMLSGDQAKPGPKIPSLGEAACIAHRRNVWPAPFAR